MTISEAITKAIEGGWKYSTINSRTLGVSGDFVSWEGRGTFDQRVIQEFLLMPSFWQSLGKAMGWGFVKDHCNSYCPYSAKQCPQCKTKLNVRHNRKVHSDWRYYWHRLIDHLAEGKSIEEFFQELKEK